MFITKMHIPRRTFLQGVGVTLALPLLDAMLPAQTRLSQTAANAKSRFMGVWHPHGAAPGWWSPKTTGKDFGFSYITSPLEPFRRNTVLITGLDATASMPSAADPGGDHQRGATILTGARARVNTVVPYIGTSIDQMIAKKHGQDTMLPSIQLAIEDPGNNTGVCNYGFSCAYTNSISWSAPDKPLPHQINPRLVFEQLYGDGSTAQDRLAQKQIDRSILDGVMRRIAPLKNKIGAKDQARLESYLEDIREIERRLNLVTASQPDMPSSEVPFGVPESFDDHIKLMYDLTFLAWQGDVTRVATIMLGRDSTSKHFPESGFDGPWHNSSHHDDDPKRIKDYSKINHYHVQCLAYFIEKLDKTPEGDGTMLDHSLIYKTSNMGNSHRHDHHHVPAILVGGAGNLEGNRHLEFKEGEQRSSNCLLSMLDRFDIHLDSIGDSTGRVDL